MKRPLIRRAMLPDELARMERRFAVYLRLMSIRPYAIGVALGIAGTLAVEWWR